MAVIKMIIDKMKIKELFAVTFLAAVIITLIPVRITEQLGIEAFRNTYQTYISICIIVIGAYYIIRMVTWIQRFIMSKIFNARRLAIKHMKTSMTDDEMCLLIEKYYEPSNNIFKGTAMIDISDGRKAALENRLILYRAASVSDGYFFAYNLQPYALEFLNKNLLQENIKIYKNSFEFVLK